MRAITLYFPDAPEGLNDSWLRDAVHCAVNEFVRARTPAEHYVATRYAHMDEAFRARKLDNVQQRNMALAQPIVGEVHDGDPDRDEPIHVHTSRR